MDDELPRPRDAAALIASAFGGIGDGFGLVIAAWERAAGPQVAQVATPSRLHDGELRLRCTSSAWASEVALMHAELAERMNGELAAMGATPSLRVTSIRARAGRPTSPHPRPAAPPLAPPLPPLDAASQERAATLTATLPPGPIRDRVQAAIEATARRRSAG